MISQALNKAMTRLGRPIDRDVFDRRARELHDTARLCARCRRPVSLAHELAGWCPGCGGLLLAGPGITPAAGLAMLDELQLRRKELGLITSDSMSCR